MVQFIRVLIVSVVLLLMTIASYGADAKTVIQAEKILEQIEKGEPVIYRDVIIIGDLNLRFAYLKKVPVANVDDSYIYMDYITSKNFVDTPINIFNSTFQGSVDFSHTIFNQSITLIDCNLDKGASFWDSRFYGYADFRGTYFNKTNNPIECGNFWLTGFSKGADFSWSKFNGGAFFWKAQFDKTATFIGTEFNGDATFDEVLFNQTANFIAAQFNGTAIFIRTEFKGDAELYGAKFNRSLLLLNPQFTRFEIEWDSIKNILHCDGPTYLALIKNFRDMDQYDAADDIYYQYRKWRLNQTPWSDWQTIAVDSVVLCICGYGVKPLYTIFSSIFISGMFSFIYYLIIEIKFTEALWLSVSALLSLPKELSPFGDDKYKNFIERRTRGINLIRYLYIFERLVGWGLLVVFINTLSRVMIRY